MDGLHSLLKIDKDFLLIGCMHFGVQGCMHADFVPYEHVLLGTCDLPHIAPPSRGPSLCLS